MKKILSIISLALIAACSVQSVDGGTKPKTQSQFMGLVENSELATDTEAAFKGKTKVVIGGFKVNFVEEKRESAKAGSGIGGKSTAKLSMKGVDTALMQQITDAAYADFTSKLKAKGYEIADRSALLADEDFKGANSEKSPLREESAMFFGSDVTSTYVSPSSIDKLYFTGEGGRNGGIGFGMPIVAAAGAAERIKTPVLFVSYAVDFANAEGNSSAFSLTSSVSVGQGISVSPGGGVSLIGGQSGTFSSTNGSIKLGQAIFSTDTFGEVVKTTTDTEVVAETALNVFTTVLGAGSNQTRSFEIKADKDKYKAVSGKVLADANTKIIEKMAALK